MRRFTMLLADPSAQIVACAVLAATLCTARAEAQFVTFESGQVRPLALSPDGSKLFAVNTPDDRLEIFANTGGSLTHFDSVPVGLEPVAVAARSNTEVWVVNHLSDSVSIVDVSSSPPRVIRTLLVGDEPRDLVFAGPTHNRAFITTARRGQNVPASVPPLLTTKSTPRALVWVFDANNLGGSLEGTPETIIPLFGDTPRALAATPTGDAVYAAIFESGNQTATAGEGVVCNGGAGAGACSPDGVTVPGGMAGGQVPGGLPLPNKNVEHTTGPETGLIVKFNNATNHWEDQLGRNWTNGIRFTLPDLDVFKIDALAGTPVQTASYAHVGTVLFNMVVHPTNGKVYVSNTDAQNQVRFEGPGNAASTVRGHLHEARITVIDGANVLPRHLNKHIDALPQGYRTVPMPSDVKDKSLATPTGMAIASDGTLYVAAFGSSKVGVFDSAQIDNDTFTPDPANHIEVSGGGPSGLVLDETNHRLFVLTRFDNAVKAIDTTSNMEVSQHPLHNPEPASVVQGRPFLYDARFTSSNGEASCSSCHIFGDFDSLGWDLGNPDDIVRPNPNPLGPVGSGVPFHPMKGPMTTQTLRGLANHGPMHWRGDRTGGNATPPGDPLDETLAFEAFNVAFDGLLGRDEGPLSDADMAAFTNFILQVILPPNPIRVLNNQLSGQVASGRNIFLTTPSTDGVAPCHGCHTLDPSQGFFGTSGLTTFENETQEFKVAHQRNAYQKVGMFGMPDVANINVPAANAAFQGDQIRGFGFLHDGSVDTVFDFLRASVFFLSDSNRSDLEQFILAFDTTFAPIVGQQVTLSNNAAVAGPRIMLLEQRAQAAYTLVGQPGAHECDLVVKGNIDGEARGYLFNPTTGQFQGDRTGDIKSDTDLRNLAPTPGQELTYSCVPPGSGTRVGIDRDGDGYLDRDELDAGSDPADPNSTPSPSPTPTPTPAVSVPVAAKKILVKNVVPDNPAKNKIVILSKDPAVVIPAIGSPNDPQCGLSPSGTVKATLVISSTAGETFTANLPCQNWSASSHFSYKDSDLSEGPVKTIVWKNGQFKAVLLGKGPIPLSFDLIPGIDQGQVEAVLSSGAQETCMRCDDFNGANGSDGRKFLGKDSTCPAPPTCP